MQILPAQVAYLTYVKDNHGGLTITGCGLPHVGCRRTRLAPRAWRAPHGSLRGQLLHCERSLEYFAGQHWILPLAGTRCAWPHGSGAPMLATSRQCHLLQIASFWDPSSPLLAPSLISWQATQSPEPSAYTLNLET